MTRAPFYGGTSASVSIYTNWEEFERLEMQYPLSHIRAISDSYGEVFFFPLSYFTLNTAISGIGCFVTV